jgi:uncharacterized protein
MTMKIKVSELDEQGLSVTDTSAVEQAFSDASWRLEAVSLQVDPDGADVHVHGHLQATIPQTCGRCLESFPAKVNAPVDVTLQPRPATGDTVELGVDDLDVDFYENDVLDLDRVVETETTLALPMKPLCRDDCRGLCPACGGNRNVVQCSCADRAPDPRLAALRDLASRLRN